MRATCLVFYASCHGFWLLIVRIKWPTSFVSYFPHHLPPVVCSCSLILPSRIKVWVYKRVSKNSRGSFLNLDHIFVLLYNFSAEIPSTLIREDTLVFRCSFVSSSKPSGKHWVIALIFHEQSSRRVTSQQACPPRVLWEGQSARVLPTLIGHEQVTYVKFDQVGAAICLIVSLQRSPYLCLSSVFPKEESDGSNNSLEDISRERGKEKRRKGGGRERERERERDSRAAAISSKLQRPAILYLYPLDRGSDCEWRWIKCARACIRDSCFARREERREDARL